MANDRGKPILGDTTILIPTHKVSGTAVCGRDKLGTVERPAMPHRGH